MAGPRESTRVIINFSLNDCHHQHASKQKYSGHENKNT